jgi:N6-L-threonylcarbamoyladenine synthase
LYIVRAWDDIRLLRETVDDAVGETFDKVAKMLGLEYPGGAKIEKHAAEYRGTDFIKFIGQGTGRPKDFFTYSGLKTAVLSYLQKSPPLAGTPFTEQSGARFSQREVLTKGAELPRICASFQREAVAQLVDHSISMLKKHDIKTLAVCGGVSANNYLRKTISDAAAEIGACVIFPPMEYCTDNAAMVGAAALLNAKIIDETAPKV